MAAFRVLVGAGVNPPVSLADLRRRAMERVPRILKDPRRLSTRDLRAELDSAAWELDVIAIIGWPAGTRPSPSSQPAAPSPPRKLRRSVLTTLQ